MPAAPLPKAIRDEVVGLGSADIMVGIPSFKNAATIGYVTRAAQAGLVQYFPDLRPVLVNADAGSPDGTQRVVVETEPPDYIESILLVRPRNRLSRISLTYPEIDGVGGKGAALRTIFQIAETLKVQALVVVDSDLRSIVPEWIELLAGPILKGGFDFVAPLYSRYKYDGTITNTVTYPMTRALYGLRIRQPIGGDFGVSGDLVSHYLEQRDWDADVSRFGIDIWMTTKAITGGFAVCQTRLGAKVHDPKDPGADLGPMFSQVVSTLLRLTEAHADRWLESFATHDVPVYGFERIADPPPLEVNTGRLLDELARGRKSSHGMWAAVLGTDTLGAVDRICAAASDETSFSFPDDVWSSVVYDFAAAHHARVAPMDDLVAALVPLYFGRVASLVIEAAPMTTDEAEALVERQAKAFETSKPYFIRQWEEATQAAATRAGGERPLRHPESRSARSAARASR